MKALAWAVALGIPAVPLAHAAGPEIVVQTVAETDHTWTGQPIRLPQGDATLTVTTYDIPGGAVLPEHEHPFPRYGYVLRGSIAVTSTATGQERTFKAGDVIVEAVGQWHHAVNPGTEDTKLLVIDLTPGPGGNTVLQK
jgi:quercetin dioxygenase-like cupin family protein